MKKTVEELLAAQREIQSKLQNATEQEREALEREWNQNDREIATMNREAAAKANKVEEKKEFSLTAALREAMHSQKNQVNLREAITAAGLAGKAIETEIQEILEPLHANSVLTKLGVRWYKGMPMGDISVPVMNKGNVYWAGETGAATADGNGGFGTNVVLKPKRLTGYFDISEMALVQDTIGVEEAIRREAINAIIDKFEATVLGTEAGTDDKPAGLFYNATYADASTFAKVCEVESNVEDNCVGGEMKYLLGTKAKADLRAMVKGKSTALVLEGGSVDGVPAITTQNVHLETGEKKEGIYAYGNFQNLAVATFGDLILKVDDSVAYGNGKIRIYVTAYVDAKVLRAGAFAFGKTR